MIIILDEHPRAPALRLQNAPRPQRTGNDHADAADHTMRADHFRNSKGRDRPRVAHDDRLGGLQNIRRHRVRLRPDRGADHVIVPAVARDHPKCDEIRVQFVDAGEINRQRLRDENGGLLHERPQVHAGQRRLTERGYGGLLMRAVEKGKLKGGERPRNGGTLGGRREHTPRRLGNGPHNAGNPAAVPPVD